MAENRSLTQKKEKLPDAPPSTQALAHSGCREDDGEWVVSAYRRQALKQVSAGLDRILGAERQQRALPPVLLDINPVEFRRSLQEAVFPAPREVRENLLERGEGRVLLQSGPGSGKTVFLRAMQENLLREDAAATLYPLPVYFDLAELPEGGGFAPFFDACFAAVIDFILQEKNDGPELDL